MPSSTAEVDAHRGKVGYGCENNHWKRHFQNPVNRFDGSKFSGNEILGRWREQYDKTLNHPSGPELPVAFSAATYF